MKNIFSTLSIIGLLLLTLCNRVNAQELNAQVIVQTPKLNTVDPKIFRTLEQDLKEFINNRKWTDDAFALEERIECSFLINITDELSPTRFRAQAIIQSSRPVYNSNYNTILFNHQDKTWDFEYLEYTPLEFNENAYLSELTSLVAYYVYIILGMDYDSFSPKGGEAHFLQAQTIVEQAQNAPRAYSKGWNISDGTRNRYFLVENLLSTKFKDLRQVHYNYHRNGLDQMYDEAGKGRKAISNSLSMLDNVNRQNPNTMAPEVFMNGKSEELIKLFADKKVPSRERATAYGLLVKIDPSNVKQYGKINKVGVQSGPSAKGGPAFPTGRNFNKGRN